MPCHLRSREWLLLAAVALLSPACAQTSSSEIEPDRPGFSDGTGITPRGVLGLETGLVFASESGEAGRTRTISGGNPLLRLGLGHEIELRLSTEGLHSEATLVDDEWHRTVGMADVSAGVKFRVLHETRRIPAVSVVAGVSLPLGSGEFTSGGFDPAAEVVFSKDVAAGFSLGGNLVVASLSDPDGRFAQRSLSFSLGHAILRGWKGYCESYRVSPNDRDAGAVWSVGGGATHNLGSNAQIDLEAGRTLAYPQRSWFIGFGFAFRRPLGHRE